MANPHFNVDRIDKNRLDDDPRFQFGLPKADNRNYIWIPVFYNALNRSGWAGFNKDGRARLCAELNIQPNMWRLSKCRLNA